MPGDCTKTLSPSNLILVETPSDQSSVVPPGVELILQESVTTSLPSFERIVQMPKASVPLYKFSFSHDQSAAAWVPSSVLQHLTLQKNAYPA